MRTRACEPCGVDFGAHTVLRATLRGILTASLLIACSPGQHMLGTPSNAVRDAGAGMGAAASAVVQANGGVGGTGSSGLPGPDATVALDAAIVSDAAVDASVQRPDPEDWPSFGGGLDHTRTAHAETVIDASHASTLQLSWRVPAQGGTGTPVIVGSVVYFADWAGVVYARNLVDGSKGWTRTLPEGVVSSLCVLDNRIYVSGRHANLYALDRENGATVWSTAVDTTPLAHLWSSPIVADGVVMIGVAAYATVKNRVGLPASTIATFRGSIVGLDAASGKLLWRFETTRVVGQPDMYGPGVSVWGSPAVDSVRKALFIGTGNGYATPVSPYSDALPAINYRTGALAWHNQFTAGDAFSSGKPTGGPDYDVGATPNLFTIDDGGTPRDVVGVGDKSGVYHVLDRDSGALVWQRALGKGSPG